VDGLPAFQSIRATALPALLLLVLWPVFMLLPARWGRTFFIVSGVLLLAAIGGVWLAGGITAAVLLGYVLTEATARVGASRRTVGLLGWALLHVAYWVCFWLPLPEAFRQPPLRPADSAAVFILFSGIGLTFFRLLSYYIDRVFRGQPVAALPDYLAYMLYYPQLRHGPIERCGAFAPQIRQARARWSWRDGSLGLLRLLFVFGVARVFESIRLFAAQPHVQEWLAAHAGPPISAADFFARPEILPAWQFLVLLHIPILALYILESLFAHVQLGVGRVFGVRGTENYRYPYLATSPRTIWQRWNITLSQWLSDYAYQPLSRLGRGWRVPALLLTFVYCGLLHGLQWRCLVWGLWTGLWIAAAVWWGSRRRARSERRRRLHTRARWRDRLRDALCRLGTFHWAALTVMILLDPDYCGLRVILRYLRLWVAWLPGLG
jgi:D-alanyl-lipoteichoic acid acyltransferase DltB (MBOAT superfamily)